MKLQASGTDYICLDPEKSPTPEEKVLPKLAEMICDRRLGVGGTGLILLSRDKEGKITVRVISAQGDEGEECGAAFQCAARYIYDTGWVTAKEFAIQGAKRAVTMEIIDSSNIRQDLGPPLQLGGVEELKEFPDTTFARPIIIENHEYSCTPVVLETPQAVLFVTGFGVALQRLAPRIKEAPLFPNGAESVAFVRLFSREEMQVRAFRQSVRELPACPKVAGAALVAAALNGFTERDALVHLRGGDVFVEWEEATNHVFFTGPADYVFSGNYYFEE